MSRLVWKKHEKEAVIKRAAQLRGEDSLLTCRDALYRAQGEVIEPARRKNPLTWHLERVMVAAIEKTPPIKLPPKEAPPPPKSPIELLMEVLSPAIEQIADAIGERVSKRVEAVVLQAAASVAPRVAVLPPPSGEASEAGHRPKTKVLILGCDASQRREIEKRFPRVDFKFIDGAESGKHADRLSHAGEWRDYVPRERAYATPQRSRSTFLAVCCVGCSSVYP